MILLGCDPGLATFGAVIVEVASDARRCVGAGTFTSEPSGKKQNVAVAHDRVRRARELVRWLDGFAGAARIDVCAAEEMSFPNNPNAVVSISLGWGVLVAWLEARSIACVAAHPKAWRKALCASGNEADAHRAAHERIASPALATLHELDALGVAAWSLTTDVVRASMR